MNALSAGQDLAAYYAALAKERHELPGATLLHTPLSPVIGANAAFLWSQEGAAHAGEWFRRRGAPVVLAMPGNGLDGEVVLRLRTGAWPSSRERRSEVVVEQVSRLQLTAVAEVLCRAWSAPGWSAVLARSLSAALEERRDFTLLLAYGEGPVGALLLLGGAAHLWGATQPEVLTALLDRAGELVPTLTTSLPDAFFPGLSLAGESRWTFLLR